MFLLPKSFVKGLMRTRIVVLILLCGSGLNAENLEKTQKKELEAQVKTIKAEAEGLEKSGQLAEARIKYAESQALIEVKEVTEAIKHLDDEIKKRVKDNLNESRKLYEARKFKEAATVLDAGMKLQAFQPVLAYNLALCYYQLGDRTQALEYLKKARSGTSDPKEKQKLSQLQTFFMTGENGLTVNDRDRERITRVNGLADNVGMEASLEDEGGSDESFSASDQAASEAPAAKPPAQALLKTERSSGPHSETHTGHRSSLCNALSELKGTLAASPASTFNPTVRSPMDEPPKRCDCWRNIWKCLPACSMPRKPGAGSPT
jgi:tetratricopeptide (TPR) repeat protein